MRTHREAFQVHSTHNYYWIAENSLRFIGLPAEPSNRKTVAESMCNT